MRVAASHTVENAFWTSIAAALDANANPGQALVYSGTCPARGVAVSLSNPLILTFTLAKPCAASIANGVLTFNTGAYAMVASTYAHSFVRFQDGAGAWVMDVDSGVLSVPLGDGSLAAWQFDAASYAIGALIVPTSLVLQFPT
jgi:hypothetical protein